MSPQDSALVVLVSEAEDLVRPFRERRDPSAAMGMPAHVTLLYPFLAPDDIGESALAKLAACVRRFSPFQFALAHTRRFPGVLYLGPEPDARLLTCCRLNESPKNVSELSQIRA